MKHVAKPKIKICGLIAFLSVVVSGFSGCGAEKDEIIPQVVQPVNLSIPYEETFDSAENVAIQYSNYIRNGYYDYAYDLLNIPDDVLFSRDDLAKVEEAISGVSPSWILYDVQPKTTYVQLSFGQKIGEAFDKKTDTWLGDIVKETTSVAVPLDTGGSKPYMIGVDDTYLSKDIVAVRLPDFVDVWVGDMLLSDKSRDDNGYYLISNFVGSDTLTLKVNSDIESRDIVLNLSGVADSKEEVDGYTEYATVMPTGEYAGGKAYDVRWETSRVTNDSAMEYLNNEGVQAILTSICDGEDFYTGSYTEVMSENANLEALKPMYTKLAERFAETRRKTYTDLTVISVDPYDEATMKRKGLAFAVTDRHTMQAWVTVKYSYVVTEKETGEQTVKSGTAEGEVGLSKDNGEWKMMYISDKLLKAML